MTFDPEVVTAFRKLVAPYPAGTEVELADGGRGIVAVAPGPTHPDRADRPRHAWAGRRADRSPSTSPFADLPPIDGAATYSRGRLSGLYARGGRPDHRARLARRRAAPSSSAATATAGGFGWRPRRSGAARTRRSSSTSRASRRPAGRRSGSSPAPARVPRSSRSTASRPPRSTPRSAPGPRRPRRGAGRAARPRDAEAELLVDRDDLAAGDAAAVDEQVDRLAGHLVRADDRAGADLERLADRHRRAADLDRQLDRHVEHHVEVAVQVGPRGDAGQRLVGDLAGARARAARAAISAAGSICGCARRRSSAARPTGRPCR